MTDTPLVERLRGLSILRLEQLEGPSREADADIYIALFIPAERVGRIDRLGGCVGWWPKDAPYVSAIDVPAFTASLDAAVALVERVLPEWKKQLFENWDGLWIARVTGARRTFGTDYMRERAPAGSPNGAIALLIAALEALAYEQSK